MNKTQIENSSIASKLQLAIAVISGIITLIIAGIGIGIASIGNIKIIVTPHKGRIINEQGKEIAFLHLPAVADYPNSKQTDSSAQKVLAVRSKGDGLTTFYHLNRLEGGTFRTANRQLVNHERASKNRYWLDASALHPAQIITPMRS